MKLGALLPRTGQEVGRTCREGHPLISYAFKGPWFPSDEAAAYLGIRHRCGCPSIKAFWNWRVRPRPGFPNGVITVGHRVLKADLDLALRQSKFHQGKRQRLAS